MKSILSFAALALATCVNAIPAKGPTPKGFVSGKAFNRIVFIWLENTDFEIALGDPNLAYFAKKGITLTNKFGVTHPSEPNYCASFGGDTFGMDNDNLNMIPANVSTIVDLLEPHGISWGEYQEDMPSTGFQGFQFLNQVTGANDYVRKHNPAVLYNSIANSQERLNQIKNFTLFYEDLEKNALPQWIFITPNMTDDGHDTSVTVAGQWTRRFLDPLLEDERFMQDTLILITFDENETDTIPNQVLGILLGDAVPENLVGTTDNTFYDHYSQLATVEANWGLNTLGRFDVGANVYDFVAKKTGDVVRQWKNPPLSTVLLNSSYPGPFNSENTAVPQPAPNVSAVLNRRTVLPAIQQAWAREQADSYYTTALEIPDGSRLPVYHGK